MMMRSERSGVEDVRWWTECQPHIRTLRAALDSSTVAKDVEAPLQRCVSLYVGDINKHALVDEESILIAASGGRFTPLEASFMWLGGWRPTSALLLVYSLMGVQIENEILNSKNGVAGAVRSSAVLSERQLINLTNVQKHTRKAEKSLGGKLATLQMFVSDQDMVQAVIVESSTIRSRKTHLKSVLKARISRLRKLLIQADELRLHTLHQLFLVLTPAQAARCAIAAFELAFMMRAMGSSSQLRKQAAPPVQFVKSPTPSRLNLQPDVVSSSETPAAAI